jgi:hypothetical protein
MGCRPGRAFYLLPNIASPCGSDRDHATGAKPSNSVNRSRLLHAAASPLGSLTPAEAQLIDAENLFRQPGPTLTALRVLAQSKGLRRDILIERNIDEYLRTHPFSLAHALERLRRAIHYEELARREGEDWSVAKNYVRLLLHRMAS